MIDAARFHHQEETVLVLTKDLDRFFRHLDERRLAGGVAVAIRFIFHHGRFEETEHFRRRRGIDRVKARPVPDERAVVSLFCPFLG